MKKETKPDWMDFGKTPPQATELENAILGAMLLEKTGYDTAIEILNADCFYSDANQKIFKSMSTLAAKNMPIDMLTVVEELTRANELEIIGGPFAIVQLTKSVVSAANIETHCRIVLQKFIGREIIRVAGELITGAYDPAVDVFDLLDKAEENIMQVGTQHVHGGMISISHVLNDAIRKIEEWRQNEGQITGITSGFPEIDKATRGWQPGDLIILGARPSVGKTAMALNLIRNAAMNPNDPACVAVWSLEMKAVYLALRMLAAESEIYLHRLQTGRMDEQQMNRLIRDGVNKLRLSKIFFDESTSVTLAMVRAKARKLKKKEKLRLIVIDYLQLMGGENSKGNREQEIAKISRGLKNLAQELEVPIIALSQLSRESDKGITWMNGPGISSMRESGAIEQDADLILLLWGPTDGEILQDGNLQGRRKIKIAKQRNGMLATIELDFQNDIQLFKAIEDQVGGNFRPMSLYKVEQAAVKSFENEMPF